MSETYNQLAKRIFGDLTDDQAEVLLWHCTAFPCNSTEQLKIQLAKVREESGGDFALAMQQATDDIEESMKEVNK